MTSTSVFFLLWWKNCDSDLFALILINNFQVQQIDRVVEVVEETLKGEASFLAFHMFDSDVYPQFTWYDDCTH